MFFFQWIKKIFSFSIYIALIVCGFYACASVGSPGGGDYDVEPPRFLRSTPEPNTTDYSGKKISLWFDEYITLDNPLEKIIITPPQLNLPVIQGIGKKVTVELNDTLIPNTTYTFDFTDAITDNNEKNPLEGFTFAFSTGEVIDTLEISGLLLNADNLEPMPKIIVGIHSDLSDTAFKTLPFVRTSQTNDRGRFSIRNIPPGTYRLFALKDANRDFRFDQPGEAIAFYDSLIVPSFVPAMRMDTIWKDTLTIDTVLMANYTRFLPDNIIMKLFEEENRIQYLSKNERTAPHQFILEFNSNIGMPPQITLLNGNKTESDWYLLEQLPDQTTMTYWITDTLVAQQDTLRIKMDYLGNDSLNNLVTVSDTVRLYQRGRNRNQNKDKDEKEEKIEFLEVQLSPAGLINIFDTLKIRFSEPLMNFDPDMIIIEQKVDTLWERRDFPILKDSLNALAYYVDYRWPYKEEFQLRIDSAAFYSFYGKWNEPFSSTFKTRAEEDYGHLYVQISGINQNGFGQLINAGERVIKESFVVDGELIFENIQPGKYYLRYIDDKNRNGKWDTGNYEEHIQPEDVYYYPGSFEIKRYMEWEQPWNVTAIPIEMQKPLEITKNKPVEKNVKRDRNANQKNTRN